MPGAAKGDLMSPGSVANSGVAHQRGLGTAGSAGQAPLRPSESSQERQTEPADSGVLLDSRAPAYTVEKGFSIRDT